MMKISRRTFLKSGLSGAALVACGTVPTKWIRPAKASVVAKKLRTTAGAVMPVPVPASSPKLLPTDLAQYSQHGYGNWQIGEGIAPEKRLDFDHSEFGRCHPRRIDFPYITLIESEQRLNSTGSVFFISL